MKKIVLFLLLISIVNLSFSGVVFSQTKDISYTKKTIILQIGDAYYNVNGCEKEIDPGRGTVSTIVNSRTLLPLRAIAEEIGGRLEWEGTEKRVTVVHNNKTIIMWIGDVKMLVDDIEVTTDVAPTIINSRTFLPLRFIAENFGCEVGWEQETKTVTIVYEASVYIDETKTSDIDFSDAIIVPNPITVEIEEECILPESSQVTGEHFYESNAFSAYDDMTYDVEPEVMLADAEKLILENPKNPDGYVGKAVALWYLDRYIDSNKAVDEYLIIEPYDIDAYMWKVDNFVLGLNDYESGIEIINQILQKEPDNSYAYKYLGDIYYYKGDLSSALYATNKAIEYEKNPDNLEEVYLSKADILLDQRDIDSCIETCIGATKIFPTNIQLLLCLANCYYLQSKYDLAISTLEKMLAIDNEDYDALYYCITTYMEMEEYKKAEELNEFAKSVYPYDPTFYMLDTEIQKTKIPEAQRVVEFIEENYLYLNEVENFEEISAEFKSKTDITAVDVYNFVEAIRVRQDKYSYVMIEEDFDLYMNESPADSVVFSMLNNDTAYMKVRSFTMNTGFDFNNIINSIENTEEKNLVIDLRYNPGGLTMAAEQILDNLLPEGEIFTYIDREGNVVESFFSFREYSKFKQIIVLINDQTISSAELVAFSLKKALDNVVLIGQSTYGKNVTQVAFQNKGMKYAIFITNLRTEIMGQDISKQPIEPDIPIDSLNDLDYMDEVFKLISKNMVFESEKAA